MTTNVDVDAILSSIDVDSILSDGTMESAAATQEPSSNDLSSWTPEAAKAETRRQRGGYEVGYGDTFLGGIDQGQALAWRAAEAAAQAFGFNEQAEEFARDAYYNETLASFSAPTRDDSLLKQAVFGLGTGLPAIGAALGGAAAAPVLGAGAATGATVGGVLGGMALTQGDLQSKARELAPDNEHTANFEQLALGAALTIPDFFLARTGAKVFAPVLDGAKDTAIRNAIRNIGGAAAISGVTEGVQDLGTNLGANYVRDLEIDEDRLEVILDSAIHEATIGAVLGTGLGGVTTTADAFRNMQSKYDESTKPTLVVRQGDNGDVIVQTPVKDAPNQPSMITRKAAPLFGNLVDPLVNKFPDNKAMRKFASKFAQRVGDRDISGEVDVHADARVTKGELKQLSPIFDQASNLEKQEAFDIISRGDTTEIYSNPVAKDLSNVIHGQLLKKYEDLGGAITEEMRRPDYLPLIGSIDWGKIAKNPENSWKLFEKQAVKQDMSTDQVKAMRAKFDGVVANIKKEGSPHSYDTKEDLDSTRIKVMEALKEGRSDQGMADVKSILVDRQKAAKKKAPIEIERAFPELDQDFFENNFIIEGRTPAQRIDAHYQLMAERLAHMKKFGANNEIFYKDVYDVIMSDPSVSLVDVERMFDTLATSQRIPTKEIPMWWQDTQDKVRAFENITLLGLSVIPSLAETILIPHKFGIKNSLTALGQTLVLAGRKAARMAGKDIPKNELEVALNDLGLSLMEATNSFAHRIGTENFNLGKWETRFIQATGLPMFTLFSQAWAATAAQAHIKDMAKALGSGKLSKAQTRRYQRKLNEAGLDIAQTMSWADAAETTSGGRGHPYYPALSRRIRQLVDDTIIDPSPADKGLWMSDPRLRLISQLKSYAVVFTNRVLPAMARATRQGGAVDQTIDTVAVASFVATYLAAQVYLAGLREFVKTGETEQWEDRDWNEHLMNALAYFGIAGLFIDPFKADQYGRDPVSTISPAISDANLAVQITGDLFTDPEAGVEKLFKRLVPNMPFSGIAKEQVEEINRDAFGAF